MPKQSCIPNPKYTKLPKLLLTTPLSRREEAWLHGKGKSITSAGTKRCSSIRSLASNAGQKSCFQKKTQFFFGGGGPSTFPAPPGESAPPKRGGGQILPPKSGGGEILLCKKKIDNFLGGGGPSAPLAPPPRGGLRPLPGQGLWPLHLN